MKDRLTFSLQRKKILGSLRLLKRDVCKDIKSLETVGNMQRLQKTRIIKIDYYP